MCNASQPMLTAAVLNPRWKRTRGSPRLLRRWAALATAEEKVQPPTASTASSPLQEARLSTPADQSESVVCSFYSEDRGTFFRTTMYRQGLGMIDMEADGNCLFRSVSDQIFGDAERRLQADVVEK